MDYCYCKQRIKFPRVALIFFESSTKPLIKILSKKFKVSIAYKDNSRYNPNDRLYFPKQQEVSQAKVNKLFPFQDHDLPDLPENLEGFGIAQAFDRYVYICGGYDRSSTKSATPACSGCGKMLKQK